MLRQQVYAPACLIALTAGITPDNFLLGTAICTIGRSPLCHLVVRHALVSRHHAKIERFGDVYILTDIGSANGTFVNGKQLLRPQRLRNGDMIGLGGKMATVLFIIPSSEHRANPDG